MPFRTRVYDSIVAWLVDGHWHEIRDLERITKASELWLAELKRDPDFDVDAERGTIRLRPKASQLLSA